jgi:hypothetical protein
MPAPIAAPNPTKTVDKTRVQAAREPTKDPNRKNTAMNAKATRCRMQSGQGIMSIPCSTYSAYPSSAAQQTKPAKNWARKLQEKGFIDSLALQDRLDRDSKPWGCRG